MYEMSFVARGTKIKLIDGNDILVEDLKKGDDVLAYDRVSRRVVFGAIEKIEKTDSRKTLRIKICENEVFCNIDTKFFSENGTIPVKEILGKKVLCLDNFSEIYSSVQSTEEIEKEETVFSIKVTEHGNFVANNIVVEC